MLAKRAASPRWFAAAEKNKTTALREQGVRESAAVEKCSISLWLPPKGEIIIFREEDNLLRARNQAAPHLTSPFHCRQLNLVSEEKIKQKN